MGSANSYYRVAARTANNSTQSTGRPVIMKARNQGPQAPPTMSFSVDLDMSLNDSFRGPERSSALSTRFMGKRLKKRVVLKRHNQRAASPRHNKRAVAKSLTTMPAKYSTVAPHGALDISSK